MKAEMSLNEYLNELILAGTGVAGSITAYVQGKKNAKSTELDNVVKAIKIWQDTATNLDKKLTELEAEQEVLKKNHEDCEESKRKLEDKVNCLTEKVEKFTAKRDQ